MDPMAALAQAQALQQQFGGMGGQQQQQQQQQNPMAMLAQAQALSQQFGGMGGQQQQQQQQQQQNPMAMLAQAQALSQQFGGMGQQQPQAAPAAGVPVSTGSKAVTLPDQTVLMKDITKIVIQGPAGATMELKPAPVYTPRQPGQAAVDPVSLKGTLTKIAFDKGFTGPKWQARWFELEPSGIKYFDKEGGTLKKMIPFNQGGWVKIVNSTDQRRKDAFNIKGQSPGLMKLATAPIGQIASQYDGVVGKDHVVAVHKPQDAMNMMNSVMGQSAMGLAFGGAKKMMETNGSRTWYLAAEDAQTAQQWAAAIQHNMTANMSNPNGSARQGTLEQFSRTIEQLGGSVSGIDLAQYLDQLYS